MTSRERFELGLFEARVTIGKEDLGMCVLDGTSPYFNTTSETGPQLAEYQAKAGEQNAEVLAVFKHLRRPLSPSQVLAYYPNPPGALLPPLTSIRRACNTLTKAKALVKTAMKRKGMYGRSEHYWALPEQAVTASQEV